MSTPISSANTSQANPPCPIKWPCDKEIQLYLQRALTLPPKLRGPYQEKILEVMCRVFKKIDDMSEHCRPFEEIKHEINRSCEELSKTDEQFFKNNETYRQMQLENTRTFKKIDDKIQKPSPFIFEDFVPNIVSKAKEHNLDMSFAMRV